MSRVKERLSIGHIYSHPHSNLALFGLQKKAPNCLVHHSLLYAACQHSYHHHHHRIMLPISRLLNATNEAPLSDSTISSTSLPSSDTTSLFTKSTIYEPKWIESKHKHEMKPCHGRVKKMFKGPWRPCETALLARLVCEHGAKNWSEIAESIPGRTGKQARERWKNHLDPKLNKGPWATSEDQKIIDGYRMYGNKWSCIARLIPGRSDNDVKNRFNCEIRLRLNLSPPKSHHKAQTHRYCQTKIFVPKQLRWELDPPMKPPTMFSVFE